MNTILEKSVFIYVDGCGHKGRNQIGIGMVFCQAVLRDNQIQCAQVICEIAETYPGYKSSEAERTAIYRALLLAKEKGYQQVYLYNDHLSVVKKINDRILNPELKASDQEKLIRGLIPAFSKVEIRYINRSENTKPHRLSRQFLK